MSYLHEENVLEVEFSNDYFSVSKFHLKMAHWLYIAFALLVCWYLKNHMRK